MNRYFVGVFLLFFLSPSSRPTAAQIEPIHPLQQKILDAAQSLMDIPDISYIYGGNQIGTIDDCKQCSECLILQNPKPKTRLRQCPICSMCGLDCSHFTYFVYKNSGLTTSYLASREMLSFSAERLKKVYNLHPINWSQQSVRPGDLLVYDGHVVILERLRRQGKADIIHATGGKDYRMPGEGIQRESLIYIEVFRGPLRRVLRHSALMPINERGKSRLRSMTKK